MPLDGAHEWNRTIDLLLTKEVLYRLSYVSLFLERYSSISMERETGIEPALVAWKATVLPLNYSRTGKPLVFRIANGGGESDVVRLRYALNRSSTATRLSNR